MVSDVRNMIAGFERRLSKFRRSPNLSINVVQGVFG